MLQETWVVEDFDIPNYSAFLTHAFLSFKGGRPSGGLGIFIATALNVTVECIHLENEWVVVVLLRFPDCLVLCFNCYLPPQCSQAKSAEIWEKMESSVIYCMQIYPKALVLVGGDLNARIGPNNETLFSKFGFSPPGEDTSLTQTIRWSLDLVVNFAGFCLAQFAYKLNLNILNGAVKGDCPGQFTFWSGNRQSTIDYFLVSQDLLPRITNLSVEARTESDHLPLNLNWIVRNHPLR